MGWFVALLFYSCGVIMAASVSTNTEHFALTGKIVWWRVSLWPFIAIMAFAEAVIGD